MGARGGSFERDDAAEDGYSEVGKAQDATPPLERLVGGEDRGAAAVPWARCLTSYTADKSGPGRFPAPNGGLEGGQSGQPAFATGSPPAPPEREPGVSIGEVDDLVNRRQPLVLGRCGSGHAQVAGARNPLPSGRSPPGLPRDQCAAKAAM